MAGEAAPKEGRLPGEDTDQASAEDAHHWVAVYDDLMTAVEGLLAKGGLEDRARLEAMLVSFERRRRYWARRSQPYQPYQP